MDMDVVLMAFVVRPAGKYNKIINSLDCTYRDKRTKFIWKNQKAKSLKKVIQGLMKHSQECWESMLYEKYTTICIICSAGDSISSNGYLHI